MPTGLKNIKIVVVDCPYDTWGNQDTNQIFVDMIDLKLRGYQKEYPYGVLPVDTNDFIGTHLLLCEKVNSALKPIVSYKSISYRRCKIHNVKFPMLNLPESCNATEHIARVNDIMKRCIENNISFAYQGGWTIDPEVRKDKQRVSALRELLMAAATLYGREYGIQEILGAAATRFKADQYFQSWGYRPLSIGEKELSPIKLPTFFNEEVKLVHLKEFSKAGLLAAEKWRFYWNKRITIEKANQDSLRRVA